MGYLAEGPCLRLTSSYLKVKKYSSFEKQIFEIDKKLKKKIKYFSICLYILD